MPPNKFKKRQRLDPSVAAKLIFGNQKRRMRKLLKKSVEAYEQFERMKPFWS